MLGSNLSAVAGDGNMGGGMPSDAYCPLSHVSVPNALNPRALARNKYPVGPPEALVFLPYIPTSPLLVSQGLM